MQSADPRADLFNEDSLREAIVGVWGEHGAHAEVFDHVVTLARREANTRDVLAAYEAHHANSHPTCNIGRPPKSPRPEGDVPRG